MRQLLSQGLRDRLARRTCCAWMLCPDRRGNLRRDLIARSIRVISQLPYVCPPHHPRPFPPTERCRPSSRSGPAFSPAVDKVDCRLYTSPHAAPCPFASGYAVEHDMNFLFAEKSATDQLSLFFVRRLLDANRCWLLCGREIPNACR